MSGFLGAAMPTPRIMAKDMSLVPTYRARNARPRKTERSCLLHMPCGYANDFWPGNRGFVGDYATDVGMWGCTWARRMERVAHGVASRVGFVGVTRDQYGAPLAGVTCSLFLTATRAWIMDIVSDANGAFLLQSFYSPDTHFIVFAKAGSPNVYGATDQNLVGA
jgi:hypothetical protein